MILSVDPGFRGALAILDPKSARLVALARMPLRSQTRLFDGAKENHIDAEAFAHLVIGWQPTLAVLEKVHGGPKMGSSTAFRFGEGFGVLQGVLSALRVPIRTVPPSVWKPAMGVGAAKDTSKAKAIQLFPEWADDFLRDRKSADLAEAALLGWYGRRLLPGYFEAGETVSGGFSG